MVKYQLSLQNLKKVGNVVNAELVENRSEEIENFELMKEDDLNLITIMLDFSNILDSGTDQSI